MATIFTQQAVQFGGERFRRQAIHDLAPFVGGFRRQIVGRLGSCAGDDRPGEVGGFGSASAHRFAPFLIGPKNNQDRGSFSDPRKKNQDRGLLPDQSAGTAANSPMGRVLGASTPPTDSTA